MLRQAHLASIPSSVDVYYQTRQAKNTAKASFCAVCDADARFFNYGALSCYSCKTFFRRHCFRWQHIRRCQSQGHCPINRRTRKVCTPCRLAKCFTAGMSTDFIRKEYQEVKCTPALKLKQKTLPTFPITTTSLLTNDRSTLSTSEWALLSNIIHAFDKFSLVPSMRAMIERLNRLPSIGDIQVFDTFQLFAAFYSTVESFMRATADFQVLTTAEQRSLFQRNLHGLFNLCGTFMLRDAGMFDNTTNESIIVPLYGRDIVRQARRMTSRLDFDSTLVKTIHIVFAFSTNCYTVNYEPNMRDDALLRGAFRLLGSQNVYVEILWKYMLYRFGDEETVYRFTALVKQMLDLIVLSAGIYNDNAHHQILVDELVEEAKTALVLEKNEVTRLWGKN